MSIASDSFVPLVMAIARVEKLTTGVGADSVLRNEPPLSFLN